MFRESLSGSSEGRSEFVFTETPGEVIEDLIDSAETAYRIVGSTFGINPEIVHSTNHCIDVVDVMGDHLCNELDKGYEAAPMFVTYGFMPHEYISLYPPNSDRRIIADPTWQQFLPASERTSDKPKVLIGTPTEVGKQLSSYGFTPEQVAIWSSR